VYIPHGLETPIVIGKPAPFVSTFVDAVDAALCANRQVLQALRILELVQFCPACPRDFHALAWGTPAIRHARSRMSFFPYDMGPR